ncbi:hypothetical protein SPI_03760 [Niveomyces insectorum RCEF 264]|uniref:Uncharacterized protein n=1 Tax=Niveomyces insectorum RCEF 264 TaxID=1081102 RepID=A0A167WC16_9HYPO|nr:hypothetical protein SPI_03760 [Niveomyces insectorum RCEF 264]
MVQISILRAAALVGLLGGAGTAPVVRADVVVLPGGLPRPYTGPPGATSMDDFYRRSAANEFVHARNDTQVLMAVYDDSTFEGVDQVLPSSESVVRGALQAWADHLHLVLRPDEVWFTILSQLFFYASAHPDRVAPLYQPRNASADPMTLRDFEWFRVIQDFKYEAERRCTAPWLMLWAMPNFTTSTVVDEMTSTILLLGQDERHLDGSSRQQMRRRRPVPQQPPSSPSSPRACGLPSVTLQGAADDWAQLLAKLDRLPAFGAEPAAYRAQLVPILRRCLASFNEPDSAATRAFWNQIVTATTGAAPASPATPASAPEMVSGWLAGLFYWDAEGHVFGRRQQNGTANATTTTSDAGETGPTLTLDNVTYPAVAVADLPIAYARAPFLLHDYNNTDRFEAYVLAGTLGKQIAPGPPDGYADALRRANQTALLPTVNATVTTPAAESNTTATRVVSVHSALQPTSAWMLYGPADFGAREQRWVTEPELVDLAGALRSSVVGGANDTQCQWPAGGKR